MCILLEIAYSNQTVSIQLGYKVLCQAKYFRIFLPQSLWDHQRA